MRESRQMLRESDQGSVVRRTRWPFCTWAHALALPSAWGAPWPLSPLKCPSPDILSPAPQHRVGRRPGLLTVPVRDPFSPPRTRFRIPTRGLGPLPHGRTPRALSERRRQSPHPDLNNRKWSAGCDSGAGRVGQTEPASLFLGDEDREGAQGRQHGGRRGGLRRGP